MKKFLAGALLVGSALLACSTEDTAGSGASGGASSGGASSAGSGGKTGNGGASGSGAAGSGATTSSGGAAGNNTGGGGGVAYDCKNPAPAWLLCDDFEGMGAGFDSWLASSPWTENIGAKDPGRMTSSTEAHRGGFSLYMPAAASAGYQGADLMFRTCSGQNKSGCALTGYDKLYFRAFFKLAPDHERVHHFLSIGGSQKYWDAYGNAGCRPDGTRHMGTTVDFKPLTHSTFFYSYFPDMKCESAASCSNYADPKAICDGCATKGMPCTNGLECCWGETLAPSPEVTLPLDKWVCLEMMMKANDPGKSNGEMAYFIDGVPAHQLTTMAFRATSDLKLNMVRLQHYLETSDAKSHSNRIWFDDVVVSTEPIGCQ
ncbi:MAG: hypothetical protein IPI67_00170 [Myxococcales bacterium]|nr:hypothetical protein [Myxococcales bacterium]